MAGQNIQTVVGGATDSQIAPPPEATEPGMPTATAVSNISVL